MVTIPNCGCSNCSNADCPNAQSDGAKAVHLLDDAEQLVAMGIRCWLQGERTRDFDCWQMGWKLLSCSVSAAQAKNLAREFSHWARMLGIHAQREIELQPLKSDGFCHDERLAMAMFSAVQHNDSKALDKRTRSLIGISGGAKAAPLFAATKKLAFELQDAGISLPN